MRYGQAHALLARLCPRVLVRVRTGKWSSNAGHQEARGGVVAAATAGAHRDERLAATICAAVQQRLLAAVAADERHGDLGEEEDVAPDGRVIVCEERSDRAGAEAELPAHHVSISAVEALPTHLHACRPVSGDAPGWGGHSMHAIERAMVVNGRRHRGARGREQMGGSFESRV